jgi:hypothetical protein
MVKLVAVCTRVAWFSHKSGGFLAHDLPEVLVNTDAHLDLFDSKNPLIEVVVRTSQVWPQPLRWLIGELNRVLEERDRQPTLQCGWRLSRQEEPTTEQ